MQKSTPYSAVVAANITVITTIMTTTTVDRVVGEPGESLDKLTKPNIDLAALDQRSLAFFFTLKKNEASVRHLLHCGNILYVVMTPAGEQTVLDITLEELEEYFTDH